MIDITKEIKRALVFYNNEAEEFSVRLELKDDKFMMFRVYREDAGAVLSEMVP